MLAKRVFGVGLGMVAVAGIAGCGEEPPPPGDTAGDLVVDWNQSTGVGGGGGDGGMGGMGGMGGTSTTTSSGPPTLQSACEAGCHKVEILSQELGCNPTPDCIKDCVDYGLSVGSCQNAYVKLMDCAGKQASEQTCYCSSQDGGILACQLCPQENNNFSACLEGF